MSLFDTAARSDSRLASRGSRLYKVVAYDCGIKRNILRLLVSSGCEVTVVPAATTAEEVLRREPDGIFLSNGPGDPEGVPYLIAAVRELIGSGRSLDLFGAPDHRIGSGRPHLQAEVRPPWRNQPVKI